MFGFLEVITLMLALGGFGVDSNSKAPSGDVVLEFADEDADLVVHLDIAALGPRNYKVMLGLASDPGIKSSPELLAMAKQVKANVEGVVGMAKTVAGIDLVNDLTSATAFLTIVPGDDEPQMLVVVRGAIPKDLIKKVAGLAEAKTGTIDGRATMELDAKMFLGTTKGGDLVAGPRALVEPRIDDDWKAPTRKKGSAWATIATAIDAKPFLLVAAKVKAKTVKALKAEVGDNFLGDLLTGHEVAVLAAHSDGFAMHWTDKTKAGVERVAMASDGVIDLLRASHIAPRGMAKIAMAALDSYAGQSKEVDALIKHKADLLKVIESYTGDGKFKVDVAKDLKARTFSMRATGKSFSDVVPVAVVMPIFALGLLSAGDDMAPATTKASTGKSRGTGGVKKAPVKAPAKKKKAK